MLRIVAARDGGICRVRLPGGELHAAQARAIADAGARFGSGVLELTNRANLQLRGVGSAHGTALPAALRAAGLGAATPGADEVRNVMLSPAAGIDRGARLDTRALGRAVLARLEEAFGASGDDPLALPRLSPKFSVQIDGGETLAMLGHHHDIWLSALDPATAGLPVGTPAAPGAMPSTPGAATHTEPYAPAAIGDGACWLGIGLAGSPPQRAADAGPLAAVRAAQAPDLVVALITCFVERRRPDDTRMRDVLRHYPAAALVVDAQARAALGLARGPAITRARRAAPDAGMRFGAVRQRATPDDPDARRHHVGAQAPLGRLDPAQLRALAALAERHGDGTLRLTPWQGVLLPNVAGDAATLRAVAAGLRDAGLIDSPDAPLGALLACAGAPGCAKGHADVKRDARHLASRLPRPVEVHLSGCERGCAAGHTARYALVAVPGDRYDLYEAPGAAASDTPVDACVDASAAAAIDARTGTSTPPTNPAAHDPGMPARGFGRRAAAHLTLDDAVRRIAAAAASPTASDPTAHA